MLVALKAFARADTYTPYLCSNIVGYSAKAYTQAKSYVSHDHSEFLTNLYSQGRTAVSHYIHQYPKIEHVVNTTFDSIQAVPTNSTEQFCSWIQQHSERASTNAFALASNPSCLLHIQQQSFLSKPEIFHSTPLLSTTHPSSITLYHLLHIFIVYYLTIMVIYFALQLIHKILEFVLGKSQKSSKLTTPLYLFGVEIYDIKDFNKNYGVTAEEWYIKQLGPFQQTKENADFVKRVQLNSGLNCDGPTYLPAEVVSDKPNCGIVQSRLESFDYITHLLTKVFKQYNLKPTDIDVLVINCSLFNPTPSHCAMAINHFKMRNDIVSYAIHGMGCSASAIAVNCARDALVAHPKKNPIGVVISFENLTMNFYQGKDRAMLVPNALFRVGAAAMVLGRDSHVIANSGAKLKALYECEHLIRTHIGASDEAYQCIWQEEDEQGFKGVRLHKDVPKIAGKALTINVTRLARLILPYHELVRYGIKALFCKLTGKRPSAPNFLTAVDHVCVHAGGRGVIDAIEKDFNFPPHITKPSRDVLFTYGNQSSASIWYIFSQIHPNVKRGQKVWQMTFGSGFKANSLIWRRL